MDQDFVLLFLGVLATLFVLLIFRARGMRTRQATQQEQAQKQRDIARCQAIEEALQVWLMMLKLPALEEQTQLATAARQLRIVLVEQLVNGPKIR